MINMNTVINGDISEYKQILQEFNKQHNSVNYDILHKEFTEFLGHHCEYKSRPSLDSFILWLNCKNIMEILK